MDVRWRLKYGSEQKYDSASLLSSLADHFFTCRQLILYPLENILLVLSLNSNYTISTVRQIKNIVSTIKSYVQGLLPTFSVDCLLASSVINSL